MADDINIEKNKNCTINITQIYGKDDKLEKCNIFEEKIQNKENLENEFSKRINYTETIYSQQLPKELQDDFEIKSEKIGNAIRFVTKPKTNDAYEKFPLKINLNFDRKNIKGLENFTSTNFEDIQREMYEKQIGLEIRNPFNVKEYIGNFEDPASIFNSTDINNSVLYLKPHPFPKALQYNLILFNNDFSFELEKLSLRVQKIENNTYILSNYESSEDKFDIKLVYTFKDSESTRLRFHYQIREKYKNNCQAMKELMKIHFLVRDKESIFRLKCLESDDFIANTKDFGDIYFTNKRKREFNKTLDKLNKLIYIEKVKDIKFSYNDNEFYTYDELINLVYSSLKGKNYTFKKQSYWIVPLKDEIKDKKEIFDVPSFVEYITLFGIDIYLNKNEMYLKDCKVNSIEKKDNFSETVVTAKKAIFKTKKED